MLTAPVRTIAATMNCPQKEKPVIARTESRLMFEARRDIHNGAEVVERVAGGDCDARSGMKSELQHDWSRAHASAPGGVEACDIILDRERRTDCVIGAGEGGHHRIAHGLDDEATVALHPV